MPTRTDILSPHHLGEALIGRLIGQTSFADLPVYDPHRPEARTTIASVIPGPLDVVRTTANLGLNAMVDGVRLDGMHGLDCGVELEECVVAIELKLGETRLSPNAFRTRFVLNLPRGAHQGTSVGGSMVAHLDWNGRTPPVGQPPIDLRAAGKPVSPAWLLMLRRSTWKKWAAVQNLVRALQTEQLAGVLVFEEVAENVGAPRATELALALAQSAIASWFKEPDISG